MSEETNKEPRLFSELVGESLGRASMAWSETPIGIFDSDTCCVLHIDIMNEHTKILAQQEEVIKALNEKLKISVEALEEYTDTAYDSHDYTAKDITHYAKEALAAIKDN